MTWVILIWIALTLISAFRFAAANQACSAEVGAERVFCHREARAGFRTSVGWLVAGTILLGIGWVITEPGPQSRACPNCASRLRRGVASCPECGYDTAAAARGDRPQPPPPVHDPPRPRAGE